MIGTIRERTIVKNGGRIEISSSELIDGSEVEVWVLLTDGVEEMEATDYLLSTEANRKRMEEALEELKQPENFIPLDMAEYEKRLNNA
ncbi:MAG: hypothetical protein ABIP78_12375 [Pyrinomonadaceae bacterium]